MLSPLDVVFEKYSSVLPLFFTGANSSDESPVDEMDELLLLEKSSSDEVLGFFRSRLGGLNEASSSDKSLDDGMDKLLVLEKSSSDEVLDSFRSGRAGLTEASSSDESPVDEMDELLLPKKSSSDEVHDFFHSGPAGLTEASSLDRNFLGRMGEAPFLLLGLAFLHLDLCNFHFLLPMKSSWFRKTSSSMSTNSFKDHCPRPLSVSA